MGMELQEDVLSGVYDAAVDPAAWRRLPGVVRRVVDGGTSVLWVRGGSGFEALADNVPDEALAAYGSHYHRLDPWVTIAVSRRIMGEAALGTDVLPERDMLRTEFYADFCRSYGTGQVVGASLQLADGTLVVMGVHRPLAGPRFDNRHRERLQAFLPHMQQVVRLRRRLGSAPAVGEGYDALEALAVGVLICDRSGRVRFANTAAESLAADGDTLVLGAQGRPVSAGRREDAAGLLGLVADVVDGGAGGGVCLEGQEGRRVFALVTPLPNRFRSAPGQALIVVRAADASAAFGPALLRDLFGLTPAEAEIAIALLGERSLAEIGELRGVTENTLRTQLASVMRKTDTDSQRHLVGLLNLLPPLLARRSEAGSGQTPRRS